MTLSFVALCCLAVAVSPVLSLDCCIPELTKQILATDHMESSLKQKQSYGTYNSCVISREDASRFTSVASKFIDDKNFEVCVEYTSGHDAATRSYSVKEIDTCSYNVTGENPPVAFTMYSIYASSRYTIEYGCINKQTSPHNHDRCYHNHDSQHNHHERERCADKTHFVQCAFPKGATKQDYEDCQVQLNKVVRPYHIETEIIC